MANVVRWEPFRDLVTLRSAMDDLFEKSFVPFRGLGENGEAYFPIDLSENAEEVTVRAQLPGLRSEDVEISVDGNVLTIKGQSQEETSSEGENWHRREIRRGSFARSLSLPAEVDADKAQAGFDSGVLTLRLPKREEAKPKRIEIKAASETTAARG
ncbi:MAG TPA: Hsp20/alpha crystallin family protein [Dehalococcoidia bacterium]|nr:Hsp20/alpha crystallin family protein [Dehalococcoidia bacterium]